jgi:hypothetical protein
LFGGAEDLGAAILFSHEKHAAEGSAATAERDVL